MDAIEFSNNITNCKREEIAQITLTLSVAARGTQAGFLCTSESTRAKVFGATRLNI